MDFQTPPEVCDYMVELIPFAHDYLTFNGYEEVREKAGSKYTILEPTPGQGNLVQSLKNHLSSTIITPDNFWDLDFYEKYDFIVMNPPFTPMEMGYKILYRCMDMSDHIIALMPWLTMINSEKRTQKIMDYGLVSITHLPRSVFKGSRVQCCILEMDKTWNKSKSPTFHTFNFKK